MCVCQLLCVFVVVTPHNCCDSCGRLAQEKDHCVPHSIFIVATLLLLMRSTKILMFLSEEAAAAFRELHNRLKSQVT